MRGENCNCKPWQAALVVLQTLGYKMTLISLMITQLSTSRKEQTEAEWRSVMLGSWILAVFCVCLFFFFIRIQRSKNFPPGPEPIPIFGNLFLLNIKNPLKDFERVLCHVVLSQNTYMCSILDIILWLLHSLVCWALWERLQPVYRDKASRCPYWLKGNKRSSGDQICWLFWTSRKPAGQPCDGKERWRLLK